MIDYKTSAKPRIVTKDDVAVFCSYDEILSILAEMDNDKLSEILKDLQETENFDMDLTGFDEDALSDLIGEQLTSDDIEEDEVPETQETVFTKFGIKIKWFSGGKTINGNMNRVFTDGSRERRTTGTVTESRRRLST